MDTKYSSMYMYSTCIYITSYEMIRGIVGMSRAMCAPRLWDFSISHFT
jgi:hypothetical protein